MGKSYIFEVYNNTNKMYIMYNKCLYCVYDNNNNANNNNNTIINTVHI